MKCNEVHMYALDLVQCIHTTITDWEVFWSVIWFLLFVCLNWEQCCIYPNTVLYISQHSAVYIPTIPIVPTERCYELSEDLASQTPDAAFQKKLLFTPTFPTTIILICLWVKKILFTKTLHCFVQPPFTFLFALPQFFLSNLGMEVLSAHWISSPDICDVEKSFSYSSHTTPTTPPLPTTVDRLQFPCKTQG